MFLNLNILTPCTCMASTPYFTSFFFRHDLENTTDRSVAVVTSLATVLNRTFQTRSSSASSIIDKCPQFVSKEKRQNRIFGKAGVNKKAVTRQRHNFELKQYFQIKYCNHSMELIWGVAPQAYQCTRKYNIIMIKPFSDSISCLYINSND